MSKKTPLFIILLMLIGSALACSESIIANPSPAPENSQYLFQDDFSDPSSGWVTEREEDHIIDYEHGGFRIWGNRSNYDYWSIPNMKFGDVSIEVDTSKLSGPDDNSFGVLCRYQNENFYGFLISSDGYYGISKRKDGDHQIIGTDGMKVSARINKGGVSNHIRADCIGSTCQCKIEMSPFMQSRDVPFAKGC
jgi:hypothetical protein